MYLCRSCDMHSRGERIVGGLRHIDIVVGMQQIFFGNDITAMGNHLIDIHIALCTTACLPNGERKLIRQFSLQNIIAYTADQLTLFFCHFLRLIDQIDFCTRFFQQSKRGNDLLRHFFRSNRKILKAALGLCTPARVCRHANGAHRIMFFSKIHCFLSPNVLILSYKTFPPSDIVHTKCMHDKVAAHSFQAQCLGMKKTNNRSTQNGHRGLFVTFVLIYRPSAAAPTMPASFFSVAVQIIVWRPRCLV